jgi:hypothetical protein
MTCLDAMRHLHQVHQRRAQAAVIVGDEVIDERRHGSQLPPGGGFGLGLLAANLVEDGVGVEPALAARVGERAAPAAAEIKVVRVEDAGGRGMGYGKVSTGRGVCHGQPSAQPSAVGVPAGCPVESTH